MGEEENYLPNFHEFGGEPKILNTRKKPIEV